jgi:hypothetical protein
VIEGIIEKIKGQKHLLSSWLQWNCNLLVLLVPSQQLHIFVSGSGPGAQPDRLLADIRDEREFYLLKTHVNKDMTNEPMTQSNATIIEIL